jgi:hypothetical protein
MSGAAHPSDVARLAKRKASEAGGLTTEELRRSEEALSAELEALLDKLSDRKSMSREEFDRHMAWVDALADVREVFREEIDRRCKPSILRRLYLWVKSTTGAAQQNP